MGNFADSSPHTKRSLICSCDDQDSHHEHHNEKNPHEESVYDFCNLLPLTPLGVGGLMVFEALGNVLNIPRQHLVPSTVTVSILRILTMAPQVILYQFVYFLLPGMSFVSVCLQIWLWKLAIYLCEVGSLPVVAGAKAALTHIIDTQDPGHVFQDDDPGPVWHRPGLSPTEVDVHHHNGQGSGSCDQGHCSYVVFAWKITTTKLA